MSRKLACARHTVCSSWSEGEIAHTWAIYLRLEARCYVSCLSWRTGVTIGCSPHDRMILRPVRQRDRQFRLLRRAYSHSGQDTNANLGCYFFPGILEDTVVGATSCFKRETEILSSCATIRRNPLVRLSFSACTRFLTIARS